MTSCLWSRGRCPQSSLVTRIDRQAVENQRIIARVAQRHLSPRLDCGQRLEETEGPLLAGIPAGREALSFQRYADAPSGDADPVELRLGERCHRSAGWEGQSLKS